MARCSSLQPRDTRSLSNVSRCAAFAATLWLTAACASQGAATDRTASAANATGPTPAAAQADDLAAYVPAGTALRASARGDLDGDGDEDALLAIEPTGDSASATAPRALLLLRRDAGGDLRLAATSPKAILCRNCGGMSGDPLQAMRTGKGEFTLRFEGGSRELWSSEYRFVYRAQDDAWHLADIVSRGFDRDDGKNAQRQQGPADFGDVALGAFDPAQFPADALP